MSIKTMCLYLKISYLWIAGLHIKELRSVTKKEGKYGTEPCVSINKSNDGRLVHHWEVCRTKMWLKCLRTEIPWKVERGKHFSKGPYLWEGGNGDLRRKKEMMLTKNSRQTWGGMEGELKVLEFWLTSHRRIHLPQWMGQAPGQRCSCLEAFMGLIKKKKKNKDVK